MEYQGNTLLNEFAGTDVATLPPIKAPAKPEDYEPPPSKRR